MSDTIDHFIWSYQRHFRAREELHTERLFKHLDDRLDPEVFVLGVRVDDNASGYPACVEPEDDFWIESQAFGNILERARQLASTYPESQMHHTHPMVHAQHVEAILSRGIQDAVAEVIGACSTRPEGVSYFSSWPIHINGFLVMLVVGLQANVIEAHPQLRIDRLNLHEYRTFKVPVSLIDAVTDEYLSYVYSELLKPDPGSDLTTNKSVDDILRAAGQRLMMGAARRSDTWDHQQGTEPHLFDACNRISATKYERAAGSGRFVLARKDHPALTDVASFQTPISVHNSRGARKVLELATGTRLLHLNARDIWGLTELGTYTGDAENLFEIRVIDYHEWELIHAQKVLLHVRDGIPSLPKPPLDAARLRTDLTRVFQGIQSQVVDHLISLAESAAREHHGTMLVISSKAAEEAQRLGNQSIRLNACDVTADLLAQLTPIDGAVLLDDRGCCHSIGVILDGLATDAGSPTRGARYNSAIRYVETRQEPCMAIVFSADGGVDIVTKAVRTA